MNDSLDEAALLAALGAAVAARAAVPAAFVEAGRNAYAWHGIDAELASIAYDSLVDAGQPSGVRSESAAIRAITFESAHFSIGVEITDDALFGQLVPPQPGTAELESRSGQIVAVPIDDVGCFSFGERPDGPFRLRCHTETQADVRTGWVSASPGGDPR
ncbi:MAG TPA: hypothetical protein VN714_15855 [Trebonia sp.]|nr:hypothetical protein [Trebonia sp.]